jgi:hypothetical protein
VVVMGGIHESALAVLYVGLWRSSAFGCWLGCQLVLGFGGRSCTTAGVSAWEDLRPGGGRLPYGLFCAVTCGVCRGVGLPAGLLHMVRSIIHA